MNLKKLAPCPLMEQCEIGWDRSLMSRTLTPVSFCNVTSARFAVGLMRELQVTLAGGGGVGPPGVGLTKTGRLCATGDWAGGCPAALLGLLAGATRISGAAAPAPLLHRLTPRPNAGDAGQPCRVRTLPDPPA